MADSYTNKDLANEPENTTTPSAFLDANRTPFTRPGATRSAAYAVSSAQLQNPVPELNNQDFFPGMGEGINVGQVSGKVIGSQPIFTATGNYIPFAALSETIRANQQAKLAQQEAASQYQEPIAPLLTNPKWQGLWNQSYRGAVEGIKEKARMKYGEDWSTGIQRDPELIGEMSHIQQDYDALARHGNKVFDRVADLRNKDEAGTWDFSPDTRDLLYSVEEMKGPYAQGDVRNLWDTYGKLEGSVALDEWLKTNFNSSLKPILDSPEVRESIGYQRDGNMYKAVSTRKKTVKNQLDALADQLMKNTFRNSPVWTKESLSDALQKRFGDVLEQQVQMTRDDLSETPTGKAGDVATPKDVTEAMVPHLGQNGLEFPVNGAKEETIDGSLAREDATTKPMLDKDGKPVLNEYGNPVPEHGRVVYRDNETIKGTVSSYWINPKDGSVNAVMSVPSERDAPQSNEDIDKGKPPKKEKYNETKYIQVKDDEMSKRPNIYGRAKAVSEQYKALLKDPEIGRAIASGQYTEEQVLQYAASIAPKGK